MQAGQQRPVLIQRWKTLRTSQAGADRRGIEEANRRPASVKASLSVALGQRAPNRAAAREEGRGLGAGMKGAPGQGIHRSPDRPKDKDKERDRYGPHHTTHVMQPQSPSFAGFTWDGTGRAVIHTQPAVTAQEDSVRIVLHKAQHEAQRASWHCIACRPPGHPADQNPSQLPPFACRRPVDHRVGDRHRDRSAERRREHNRDGDRPKDYRADRDRDRDRWAPFVPPVDAVRTRLWLLHRPLPYGARKALSRPSLGQATHLPTSEWLPPYS